MGDGGRSVGDASWPKGQMISLESSGQVRSAHKHYIHRLRLPAHAAGKICTVVNLGSATAA